MEDTHGGDGELVESLPTAHAGRFVLDASFPEFYRTSDKAILKKLMVFGASKHEAEEALSKAMEEVMRRWPDLTNPRSYATRAALNAFYKLREAGNRRRAVEQGLAEQEAVEDPRLSLWEDHDWVTAMLQRLPPAQREAFRLHEFDGFDTAEIAELLGKTPAAVRQNLCLARKRLKRELGNYPDIAPRQRGQAHTATQGGTR